MKMKERNIPPSDQLYISWLHISHINITNMKQNRHGAMWLCTGRQPHKIPSSSSNSSNSMQQEVQKETTPDRKQNEAGSPLTKQEHQTCPGT
jgi:hypothetical protein